MLSKLSTLSDVSQEMIEMKTKVKIYEPTEVLLPVGWSTTDCTDIFETTNTSDGASFQIICNRKTNQFAHRSRLSDDKSWSDWNVHN